MDRREFAQSFAALGAAIAVRMGLAKANANAAAATWGGSHD